MKNASNLESLEQSLNFLKTLLNNYHMLKKQVFGMIQIKNSQNEYQNQLISVLTRYEDKCQTL